MIQIAICEHEKNIRGYLLSLIKKQNIECEITEYESGTALLKENEAFEILLLNIELENGGINGIETAKQIRAGRKREGKTQRRY